MRRALGLLLAGAALWPASAGAAGETYVIAGGGRVHATDVASAPATDMRLAIANVVAARDGGLLIADGNEVVRVSASGQARRVAGERRGGDSGDDGPALAARLSGAVAVTEAPDGTLFVATSRRIRRIAPDGTITTVAGGGPLSPPPLGEPIPALHARLAPTGLALAPDGGLFIADDEDDSGLLELGTDGMLRAVTALDPSDSRCGGRVASMVSSAAGLLLGLPDAVCRVDATGVRTVLAGQYRPAEIVLGRSVARPAALPGGDVAVVEEGKPNAIVRVSGSPPHAVRVPLQADGVNLPLGFSPYLLGVAADGGLLASDGAELAYLAPERPGLAALRFESGSRRALAVRSTMPGALRLTLDGPQTRRLTASLAGGVGQVRLPAGLQPGLYRVAGALRTASGARTTATTALVLGGALTDRAAARVLGLKRLPVAHAAARVTDENFVLYIDRCRRWSPTRVDCRTLEHDEGEPRPYCSSLQAVELRPDGTVTSRLYGCPARRGATAFRRRPHFTGAAAPLDLRMLAERWHG